MSIKILIVDDEDSFRNIVAEHFLEAGFQVFSAVSGEKAENIIRNEKFDIGLFDIRMPGMDGINLLELCKTVQPAAEIIFLTGYGTVENAVKAMKLGSYDYLTKPCKLSQLEISVKRAYEHKRITSQNAELKTELSRLNQYDKIIGKSPAIKKIKEFIEKVAPTDSSVLIQGESGTGKELVARIIQRKSPRSNNPFIVIDCGALEENLFNSELFGHEKGAFTGADQRKRGLVEIADGGTLFIDEVANMSTSLQSKLLRVLETGEYRRLGETELLRVDTRIIAATNRDHAEEVKKGRFREDLFYRLNVAGISLPPLRQRKEDIPLLVESLVQKRLSALGNQEFSKIEIENGVIDKLMDYDWPGNVRELGNVIERALILSSNGKIKNENLPWQSFQEQNERPDSLKELEREHIQKVYIHTGKNKTKTAEILDISLRNLYRKLKDYELV